MAAVHGGSEWNQARQDSVINDPELDAELQAASAVTGVATTSVMDLETGMRGQVGASVRTVDTQRTEPRMAGGGHEGDGAGAGAGTGHATGEGAGTTAAASSDTLVPGAHKGRDGRFATSGVLSHSVSGVKGFHTACSDCSATGGENPQQAQARPHTHNTPVIRSSVVLMANAEKQVHDRCVRAWHQALPPARGPCPLASPVPLPLHRHVRTTPGTNKRGAAPSSSHATSACSRITSGAGPRRRVALRSWALSSLCCGTCKSCWACS